MARYVKRWNMKVLVTIILNFQFSYAFDNLLILRHMEEYKTNLLCASKDDGNALVWNLELTYNQNWKQNFSKNDFSTINHPCENCITESSYDCRLISNKTCKWNMDQWISANSLSKAMGPVLDNRWEGFREYYFQNYFGNLNQFIRIESLAKTGSLVFSVRASTDVHIVLCDQQNLQNSFCYWIIIGGWVNTKSIIRKCPEGLPWGYPVTGSECSITRDFYNHALILNPNEWKHFILKWDNVTRKIALYNEKEILLKYEDENPIPNNHDNYHLFYKSLQPMLIRNHIYDYVYTNESNTVLTSPKIPFKNQSLCFEFSIGLCVNCRMNITMTAFSGNINNEIKTQIVKGYTEIYELTTWQYVKINMTFSSKDNEYVKVEIIPMIENKNNQGFWAIGSIRECPSLDATKRNLIEYKLDRYYYKPSEHKLFCQKMSYGYNEIVNAFLTTSEFANNDFDCPNGTLCSMSCENISKKFHSNCEKTVICTKSGCTCYKGLIGDQCDKRCNANRYGYACKESCDQCLYKSCNHVTGICTNLQCDNKEKYYISPYCKTVIDATPAPIINFLNKTHVSVSLIAKDEYKETITEYCFLIHNDKNEILNECKYETIFPNTTTLEAEFKFLQPGMVYKISCNLRVGQEKVIIKGFSNNFITPCDVNAHFNIKTNETHLMIKDDNPFNDNEGINYTCPWSWYNLLIIQKNNNTKNNIYKGSLNVFPFILKVEPATVYDIYINGNDSNILSYKTILSEDRVSVEPSEVEMVQISPQFIDQVYIEWKPPKRPNGNIPIYEITSMVDVYYGHNLPSISNNRTTFTITTNVTFFDLAPYAKYIFTITAYTSKKGLKVQKDFIIKSTDIPRSILSNLKLKNNRITWDLPKDCSTISGFINNTKLISTDISEAVRNQTIIKQTTDSFLDIDTVKLNNYVEVQVYPIRHFNGTHNNNAAVELIFFTPSKLRKLDIYEFDNRIRKIFLRWQKPSPRNGELDYYIFFITCNNKQSKNTYILANQSCTLWEDYICSEIKLPINKYKYTCVITVTGYNKNVSNAGESLTINYNPTTIVTKSDPPENFTIKNHDKGVVILRWSHPWKTNIPIVKFFIQVQLIQSDLRGNYWKFEKYKSYQYKIMKYQREYEWSINLLSSTKYNISIQAVTINKKKSRMTSNTINTPNSISFEKNKLTYRVESNTSILLKIPNILNDIKNSKMYIVVKGQYPCQKYSKLNENLSVLTAIKNNEIAWLAASFPANQYSGKEFSIGDNQKYEEGINCPLRSYNSYTIFVIVQAEETWCMLSLTSNRIVYITRQYEIWPIYLVVILLILFFFAYNLYRRYMRTNLTNNIFVLNENVQTNENLQKVIPASPIVSEKRFSTMENVSLVVDKIQNYDSTMMPIKVKDFEDYVRNAIKSGLLDQQYEVFLNVTRYLRDQYIYALKTGYLNISTIIADRIKRFSGKQIIYGRFTEPTIDDDIIRYRKLTKFY